MIIFSLFSSLHLFLSVLLARFGEPAKMHVRCFFHLHFYDFFLALFLHSLDAQRYGDLDGIDWAVEHDYIIIVIIMHKLKRFLIYF